MSTFKRLANLARGKVKSLLAPSEGDAMARAALERELERSTPPVSRRHQMLDQLREKGLLSDEEYSAKRAALNHDDDATATTPEPEPQRSMTPPKPKKRTL
jgi:hypothetical protein